MAADFTVRGREVPAGSRDVDPVADAFGDDNDFGYRIRSEVAVGVAARGATQIVEMDGDDDDVIEIEDRNGYVTFHRAGELGRAQRAASRGNDLLSFLATDATERGTVGQITRVRRGSVDLPAKVKDDLDEIAANLATIDPKEKVVDFLAGKAIEAATRAAMRRVVDWIDSPAPPAASEEKKQKRPKKPGLYLVTDSLRLLPQNLGKVTETDNPYLCLLHGTFSHTEGAFGGLRGSDTWRRLYDHYEGRVIALEHPTLGQTPVENVASAAEALPTGARLHLVSHSRGGLVGDVLSWMAAHAPDTRLFAAADHPDTELLPLVHERLSNKKVNVERFVRVACPARGTTLASRRIDRVAGFLFNAFKLIPALNASGVAAIIKQVLLTFLDQRTDATIVPGLEAQMPTSPLVRTLNTAPPVDDGLAVIAGDIQGSGFAKRLMVAAADLFYREDHDLVVNTSSMYEGAPREHAARSFHKGTEVHHSAYFVNEPSRAALIDWLTSDEPNPARFKDYGLQARSRARASGLAPKRAPLEAPKGTVVVVPDVFGSTLVQGAQEVWPSPRALARDGLTSVLSPEAAADATDLTEIYDGIRAACSVHHDVVPYAYDWRRTPAALVTDLRAALADGLETASGPVHIVAHGAGAHLAQIALAGSVGDEIRASGGRVVLLGPPTGGAWSTAARFAGLDDLTALLATVDPSHSPQTAGRLLSRLPLMVVTLPWDEGDETWDLLGDGRPTKADLDRARKMRTDLAAAPAATATIHGHAATIVRPDGWAITPAGDGVVAYNRLGAPNPRHRFAVVAHADLASDPAVVADVTAVLEGREPRSLLTSPPVGSNEGDCTELASEERVLLFPTDIELATTALGGSAPTDAAIAQTLHVSVVHGDLRSLETPLMVGTYDGTPLDGAEKALDKHLGYALTRRFELSQFPGPIGTYDVVVPDSGTDLWAVVIGMGDSGAVTAPALSAGVTQAALKTAALHLDRAGTGASGSGPSHRSITLSSVLIGTSGNGALDIAASLTAIADGVLRANQNLADGGYPISIDHLQFVELYEERAIAAVHASQALPSVIGGGRKDRSELAVERNLVIGCGGLPGRPTMEYNSGEWVTVRISAVDSGAPDDEFLELSYTTVGRRARAEQRMSTAQRRSLDHLISTSIEDPNVDPQLYNTLYELITPTGMKTQSRESDNLMYVLDRAASALPLEMLARRSGIDSEGITPMAVEVGLVRRLETSNFREHVRTASGKRALVIGDPITAGFARLPGARIEARRVADLLKAAGYQVTELISTDDNDTTVDVPAIFNALYAHDYRIVHIAAHGDFSPDRWKNGVVLDNDVYLTAAEIEKMQTTPDLVFLNCCHIGSMMPTNGADTRAGWRPDKLAASISRQLIDNGVRMFIGAGWAVNDQSAADFAEVLYEQMLRGADLGTATRHARKTVFDRYADSSDNTWGAYQVYGPPAGSLTQRTESSRRMEVRSAREFRDGLQNLADRAADAADQAAQTTVGDELQALIAQAPDEWCSGESDYQIGAAWFALADYDQAVQALESATLRWGADAPMRSYEQLVNVRAKWAIELTVADRLDEADAQFELAETLIDGLLGLGRTPQRLALQASLARRRMQVASDDETRIRYAEVARDAYAAAAELSKSFTSSMSAYAELNRLAMEAVVRMHRDKRAVSDEERGLIAKCVESESHRTCRDFWSEAVEEDALLVLRLLERRIDECKDEILASYRNLLADAGRRERSTIIEHLQALAAGLPDLSRGPRRAERDALEYIASELATGDI